MILNRKDLKAFNKSLRVTNKSLVFANGCFDIIHIGHIIFLKKAKRLGDFLIVAVNDDDSVKRLKGQDRPINSLESRIQLLNELRSVDYVVAFDEDTPHNLIDELKPNVLCKGSDYEIEEIVGQDIVAKNGGQTVTIPLVSGYSTTKFASILCI